MEQYSTKRILVILIMTLYKMEQPSTKQILAMIQLLKQTIAMAITQVSTKQIKSIISIKILTALKMMMKLVKIGW